MSFKSNFHEAIKKYIHEEEREDLDIVEIISVTEETEYGGYCETCAYQDDVVIVTYLNSDGDTETYKLYYESIPSLLTALLK